MRKKNYLLIIFIGLLAFASPSFAFSPFIKNYAPKSYQGGGQNWAIAQSPDNKIYIGNHYGLLEFDGYNWKLHIPESKEPVRSIYINSEGRIYVGLNQGFGYFERTEYGELVYTSLSEDIEDDILINRQIWSIAGIGDSVYFQTFTGYFTLDADGNTSFTKMDRDLYLIQLINDKIYIPLDGNLYHLQDNSLVKALSFPNDKGYRIKAMTPYLEEKDMLMFTESEGAWKSDGNTYTKWHNEIDDELKWAIPNRAIVTKDSLILVGTILNGLYAINFDGTLAWHINNKNGLQNNTVLGIVADSEENIWLSLDNGISVVYNTRFLEVKKWVNRDVGSIYDAAELGEHIYLATNQGLFKINETKTTQGSVNPKVELIPRTEGYILDLYKTSDNKLMIGHSQGIMLLDEWGRLNQLSNTGGAMTFKSHLIEGEEHILHSSYTSFNIYAKKNNNWALKNEISNFSNSIQSFEIDDNETIWAAHTIRGLYKIKLNREFTTATAVRFYPNLNGGDKPTKLGVFKVKNRIVFTDKTKCYTYNDLNDSIVPYNLINHNIEHFNKAERIVEVDRDNYWFITPSDAALVNFQGEVPQIVTTIYYDDYDFATLDEFENIVPIGIHQSVLCYNNGLAKIKHSQKEDTLHPSAKLQISFVEAYSGVNSKNRIQLSVDNEKVISLPYSHNNIFFKVSLPIFETKYRFRYWLKGLNDERQLRDRAYIDYTRLPYGKYTLVVESINRKGDAVMEASYAFIVNPPFYASNWAFILYGLLVLFASYLIYQVSRRRAIVKHRKQRLKQEKEIIKLENEKLQSENTFKSKELASYAMSMIRQNEILTTLKTELVHQKDKLGSQYPNKYYDKLMEIIDVNISSEQEWEIFQTNFDRIHEYFFRNLRQRYPELTSSDLKICAYLRLNLENKEIANLMNITIRAIETRRYRMRRKLNLDSNESLTAFLIDFK